MAVTIITDRLRLRMLVPDDADALYDEIFSDAEVMLFLPGGVPRPRERALEAIGKIQASWQELGFGLWAFERKTGGPLIGYGGLMNIPDTAIVEVAYALGRAHWGHGFASEVARASLRFGFEYLKLDRIVAVANIENTSSRRVMDKIGMRFEDVTTKYYDGDLLALHSIARQDFDPGDMVYELTVNNEQEA